MNTLGDVGPHDDPSYTGEQTSDSLPGMSMSYYRDKAREFQVLLNSLDTAYLSMIETINSGAVSQEYANDLQALANDYESHKTILKVTAEGINAGAAIINSAGGRMPQLSIPGTLGFVQIPLATAALIGTIAALTAWGMSLLSGYNDRAKLEMTLNAQATPEGRAQVARDVQRSDAALKAADVTIFGALSGSVKWIAIGVLGFFAYKYFNGHKLLK